MDELRTAAIQVACMNLVARYGQLADQREHQAFSEVFAPEGEWIRPGMHMRGREEIFRFMESRPARALTRHVCGSIAIDVADEDHARGLSYTTVYRESDYGGSGTARLVQPEMVVDYRDTFVRIDGRWHIASRHTTVVFSDKA
ncbi:MAG: hypothetical protein JWQ76_5066 [Ramlibacter sp.]|nr:hypothetical protein [Ramlibacter sp.]